MAHSSTARRGRPPKVHERGKGEYTVSVKGAVYAFRRGSDGKLRALGTPERTDDFEYAREQVEKVLVASPTAI